MKINTNHKSVNFNERISGARPEYLIMHYTECDFALALRVLTEPTDNPRSSHYLIDTDGSTYQLVDNDMRAWHAGKISYWRGRESLNSWSFGIEIVNPGRLQPNNQYPAAQMEAVIELSHLLMQEYKIPRANVLGHSDVAPQRKEDPGEHFDWRMLAQHNIGIFTDVAQGESDVLGLQNLLHQFGYAIDLTGENDEQSQNVIKAFQMHFAPEIVDGQPRGEYSGRLKELIRLEAGTGIEPTYKDLQSSA